MYTIQTETITLGRVVLVEYPGGSGECPSCFHTNAIHCDKCIPT